MRLSKRAIDGLDVPSEGYSLTWDDLLPGFGIRITAKGAKTFIYQRRVNGRTRRISIGQFGPITVEQARKIAQQHAGEIASGKDPVAERQRQRAAGVTLKEALAAYLAARPLKESTRKDVGCAMKGFSDWMARPLTSITREMIGTRHRRLGAASQARANLAMRYLRAVFNYAAAEYTDPEGRPLITDNPVRKLSATRTWFPVRRRQTLLKVHELKPWVQAVMALDQPPPREPGQGKHKPKLKSGAVARDYLLLVLLTGLRRNEALNLTWADIDLPGAMLTVRDPKNHQDHTLPLSDYLLSMLKARKQVAGAKYVFSDKDGSRLHNLRFAQERVTELSGVAFIIHDLRRTFATIADSLDIPGYAVKALLNHKQANDVTAGYIVTDVERLREPMQRITSYILRKADVLAVHPRSGERSDAA